MKLPKYSAEASLGRSSIAYSEAVGHGGSTRGAVVPAVGCSDVDCGWAAFFCFSSLDLDPVSCGLYYGCCHGAGRTGGDPNFDAGTGIPVSSNLPVTSVDPTLSAGLSDLSSQIAVLRNDLRRQLNRIERCACGPPIVLTPQIPPFIPPEVVPPVPVPPVPPLRPYYFR